jgi:hypothetical protein
MRRPRRSLIIILVVAGLAVAAPALAFWTITSTNVTGKASAHGLVAPGGALAAALGNSSIRVSYTPSSQTVSAARYRITRQTPTTAVVCTVDAATASCDDTGLLPTTTYSYTVATVIPSTNWTSTTATASATTQGGDTTAPVLQTLQILDNDTDGKIDQVVATYDENLNVLFPGAWSATGLPTAASLGTPAVSATDNKQILIPVNEGGVDTAVGTIKLTLANSGLTLPRDVTNHMVAAFTNSTPTDKALPVLMSIASANATGNNGGATKMEPGDMFTLNFSEAIVGPSLPNWNGTQGSTTVTMTDGGANNDTLAIAGVTGTITLGAKDFITVASASVTYSGGSVVLSNTGKAVTFTVGSTLQSGSAANLLKGAKGNFTVTPNTTLRDANNNQATGSVAVTNDSVF